MSDVLTSRQAAELCGVSFRTVIRWIERGLLQAYRLPGRGDYRVPRQELELFMRENAIPLPGESLLPARRVLIVEDDANMARAIERVLQQAGYETAHAPDGFAAGAMLHSYRPALMTLDLRMPGLDGLGVLNYLQGSPMPFPLKILVVSADSEARMAQALTLGADAVVRKPFDNKEFLAAVAQLLGAPGGARKRAGVSAESA
ncbi:response regulator [Pseudomonas benzenivorans]|uniref:Response regulator n=1 Tax=Pseudomonas benzenivorans TaxID=556533 RepID=A0ABY5H6Q1_9PSED|nr:response regulator [Pseudomonas benzenivorans]UTW07522.1 response regulator [Pseudomonas benzenivorans]